MNVPLRKAYSNVIFAEQGNNLVMPGVPSDADPGSLPFFAGIYPGNGRSTAEIRMLGWHTIVDFTIYIYLCYTFATRKQSSINL